MATFTTKNFPNDYDNNRFTGSGERTCYVPVDIKSFDYSDGFVLANDAPIYSRDGRLLSRLERGDNVHFTFPPKLYRGTELSIPRGTYAGVSQLHFTEEPTGLLSINRVIKPSGNFQSRINHGDLAQNEVLCWASENFGAKFISKASIGSQAPDLIVEIQDEHYQFEIKGTSSFASPITVFDKSVSRNKRIDVVDNLVSVMHPDAQSLTESIDIYREKDVTVGYSGDEGVCKSGSMPKQFTNIENYVILGHIREVILEHLRNSLDDFFVVYNRTTKEFRAYATNERNIIDVDEFPEIKSFSLRTYGGPSGGNTRLGLKIELKE